MAGFSLCTHPASRTSSLPKLGPSLCGSSPLPRRINSRTRFASSHSNPKILKPNRRSRYGKPLSPYDSDDDGLDWLSDEDGSGYVTSSEVDRQWVKLKTTTNRRTDSNKNTESGWDLHASRPGYSLEESRQRVFSAKSSRYAIEKRNGANFYSASVDTSSVGSSTVLSRGKSQVAGSSAANRFSHLAEELKERYFPLLVYLNTFGLKDHHFIQMYERHMPSLQINAESAKERLEYLMSVGVKHRDIRKIIMRQPQILEYAVENNLKSHVSFLGSLGIPESRIGQVITTTPSLFSYSVENSLKQTVKYLLDEIGIQENDLSKVLQLSSQILVQRLDNSWNTRLSFLMKELDAPRESVVKMVTKHPQILHYSIEDGICPRINFLRSIGMQESDILKVLTRLTQVLSLSLERNLKPKYMYLVNELRNEVHSLAKYPMYLSLSLDQRIRPRHRFLVYLKKAPKGPFPLSSFLPTDECFCQQWAGTSLDKYLDFRQRLLLKELVIKYQRQ